MAKLTGPLFSNSAHGSIGQMVTMLKQRGQQISKRHSKPTGTTSPKQTNRRTRFLQIAAEWAALTNEAHQIYNSLATAHKITGWNLFLSESLAANPPGLGVLWDGGAAVWDNSAAVWS